MTYVSRELRMCTAQRPNGSFCEDESLPDAPFPICLTHAAQVLRFVNDHIPRDPSERIAALVPRAVDQHRKREAPIKELRERKSVVYYLRVGALVKIGTTENLPARLRGYPPDTVVLAVEPGGEVVEKRRHAQFRDDLSHGNEWFRPSLALMQHIADVRAARAA